MMQPISVLVTGASGFLGGALCKVLSEKMTVRGTVRASSMPNKHEGVELVAGELSGNFDWSVVLEGVTAIVHCAARVHVMRDSAENPLEEFRTVNVDGTLNIARQAAVAGVKRFVFISSIGVNGGETFGKPFSAEDIAAPHTPYAVSKYEAEQGLRALAEESGMEVVIIRPPLIYGPGAPGNFASLKKLLASGIPVPLGSATKNRRSFVYLGNLVDLVEICIVHPKAANKTLLVSDDEDLSTAALLRRMAVAMGTSARLIRFPIGLLKFVAKALGRSNTMQSLCGSLEVDISQTQKTLGWSPPFDIDAGLRLTLSPLYCPDEKRNH